jgi:prepilin-type N-terminal cleavage/methylation domain-containing protein
MEYIYKQIKNNCNQLTNRGFTLVELMVVISIFVLMTTVTIFDYGSFRSNVSLQNLTDDIALSIRKAQGFAIGARAVSGTTTFDNSYGMHFSTSTVAASPLNGSNKSFLMYYSNGVDKKYDYNSDPTCGTSLNECLELFKITTADIISDIKVDGVSYNSIDIAFKRPDSQAFFCARNGLTSSCDKTSISKVDITISNGQTDVTRLKTRIISIQNTGQISIAQ